MDDETCPACGGEIEHLRALAGYNCLRCLAAGNGGAPVTATPEDWERVTAWAEKGATP